MKNIIEIDHLHKAFGDVKAVQDLSFRVREGELFAFLGINGAGKSTTINILCGQLAKDSGTVKIGGIDLDAEPDSIKRSLGVVFQNSVLDKELSVRDNLASRAALYGLCGKDFQNRLAELARLLGAPVILVIDAIEGVTEQDAKIAGIAHDRGKGIIIAVNKWDAIEKNNNTVKEYTQDIRDVLSFMPYAEILFISAKSGQRLNKIFEMIDVVIENNSMRVATGVLNEIVAEAVAMQQPPTDKGKRLKIYYVTQVSVKPPTFVVFVNDKNLMHFSYTRYLENRIRDTFGFRGTALKFITRERK